MDIAKEIELKSVRLRDGSKLISANALNQILTEHSIKEAPAHLSVRVYDDSEDMKYWQLIDGLLNINQDKKSKDQGKEFNSVLNVLHYIIDKENKTNKSDSYFDLPAFDNETPISEIKEIISHINEKLKGRRSKSGTYEYTKHKDFLDFFSSNITEDNEYSRYREFEKYTPAYRLVSKDKGIDLEGIQELISSHSWNDADAWYFIGIYCAQRMIPADLTETVGHTRNFNDDDFTEYLEGLGLHPTYETEVESPAFVDTPNGEVGGRPDKHTEESSTDEESESQKQYTNQQNKKSKWHDSIVGSAVLIVVLAICVLASYFIYNLAQSWLEAEPECMAYLLYLYPVVLITIALISFFRLRYLWLLPAALMLTANAILILFGVLGYLSLEPDSPDKLEFILLLVVPPVIVLILEIASIFNLILLVVNVIIEIIGVVSYYYLTTLPESDPYVEVFSMLVLNIAVLIPTGLVWAIGVDKALPTSKTANKT